MTEISDAARIHPTAVVDAGARVAQGVRIGPYCVIGPEVEIGCDCDIGSHVTIGGITRIGPDNRVFPFASLGLEPQDKKYAGEATRLVIGRGNTIREYVTVNRGTVHDKGVTRIGDGNWIMAYVHIAHDCRIGDQTVLANNATLAGHVQLGDYVTLGGATLVHQFCRVGEHAFTAFGARINKDVPPYVTVGEGKARPRGLNVEGLRRRGFDEPRIRALKEAYRLVYRSGLALEQAVERLGEAAQINDDVCRLRDFLRDCSRSIVR
jgi:UDP-N-acetylglucosamine acyltransferase